jgi:hypothetical protein
MSTVSESPKLQPQAGRTLEVVGSVRQEESKSEEDGSNNTDTRKENFLKGKSWRFWAIFPSLMVTTLLSAVEVTGRLPAIIYLTTTSDIHRVTNTGPS